MESPLHWRPLQSRGQERTALGSLPLTRGLSNLSKELLGCWHSPSTSVSMTNTLKKGKFREKFLFQLIVSGYTPSMEGSGGRNLSIWSHHIHSQTRPWCVLFLSSFFLSYMVQQPPRKEWCCPVWGAAGSFLATQATK